MAAVVLLGVGIAAGLGLPSEWRAAHTAAQGSVSIAVVIYVACALVAGAGVVLRRRWSVPVAVAWAVASMYAGGTATLVYGDAPLGSVIVAYVASGAACALIVWLASRATR